MKRYKYIILTNFVITIALLVSGLVYYAINYLDYETTPFNREQVLLLIGAFLQIFLAISATVALIKYIESVKWKKEEGLELFIELQEKNEKNLLLAKTFIENKTKKHIYIKEAYLEIKEHDKEKCIRKIELHYYYVDNLRVSNEKLKYIKPIRIIGDSKNETVYDIWFYVQTEMGLHRKIQSCFKAELDLDGSTEMNNISKKNKKKYHEKVI